MPTSTPTWAKQNQPVRSQPRRLLVPKRNRRLLASVLPRSRPIALQTSRVITMIPLREAAKPLSPPLRSVARSPRKLKLKERTATPMSKMVSSPLPPRLFLLRSELQRPRRSLLTGTVHLRPVHQRSVHRLEVLWRMKMARHLRSHVLLLQRLSLQSCPPIGLNLRKKISSC